MDHIEVIPGCLFNLEGIVAGAARRASRMPDNRLRHIKIRVAGKSCPPADIDVLQISKMPLVKKTNLGEDLPSVQRCRSTAGKTRLLPVIARSTLSLSTRKSLAQRAEKIARIIHFPGIRQADKF